MPVDDKTANALADFFSSPAGATALEEPAPAEGGQGEVGTPIAPKGPTIGEEQAKALADQIDQQKPGLDVSTIAGLAAGPGGPAVQWLMENVPLFRTMTKAEATGYLDSAQSAATTARTFANLYKGALEEPSNDFVGKPLEEVQAQRDKLQAQRDQLETNLKEAMDTGKMGGLQVTAASAEISTFQQKIDEANQVLQSGQIKTRPTEDTGPLAFLSDRLGALQKPLVEARTALPEAVPTSEALDQSIPGQIASGIGNMGSQLPFIMTGMAPLGFASQASGSAYYDAIKSGADEKTAEVAAILDGVGAATITSTLELPAARLANLFKGQPAAQTILEMGRAVGTGMVGMAGLQYYNNAVARLTGYAPDRPLDEGVLQQAMLGAGLSVLTEAAGKAPELYRYTRPPELEVREKPGAPPTETPQAPTPAVTPTAAPPAPTEPLTEAAAAVSATQGTPEQTLAAQGSPQEQLAKSSIELDQALSRAAAQPAAVTTPPAAPTAPETPVAAPPAPPSEPPYAIQKLREINPEAADRYAGMSPKEQASYLEQLHSSNPQWNPDSPYFQGPANIRGEAVPPPLPEGTGASVTPDQVKATTNQAATAMGMDQRVHYVASADDLPGRVRKAMSQEQLDGTAQTVYDKSMGELWVIGDRFDGTSQGELNRTLIHDILPRVYGSLSDLRIENNPNDTRLGHYDILSDRPVLNESSLLRTADPFEAASKTALEEIVAHQGLTKLLGPREAPAYIDAMHSVRQRFDSLGLSDTLAQEKGFKNLDDMAKAYGFDDYAKNPRHNNALTEELWAAYAQRYGTLARLQEQAPQWWQQAVNTLSQGLRRRLGLGISDLDVQNLVADSFGALRRPKWGLASQFHPEVAAQAKNDMRLYQLASMRGEGEAGGQTEFLSEFDKEQQRRIAEEIAAGRGPPPPPGGRPPGSAEALAEAAQARQAAGVTDMARIGDLFVAGQRTETRAGLQPGEGIRAQPFKLSAQGNRPFSERMALADRATSVYDTRTLQGVLNDAREIFQRDFGGNVHDAMEDLRRMPVADAAHPAMRAVINDATNAQIADYRARGFNDAARSLEMARDRFNREMAPKVTDLAQALNAQKLLYETSDTAVGRLQAGLIKAQSRGVGNARGVGESFRRIGEIGQQTVRNMLGARSKLLDSVQARMDALRDNPQSLATRYIYELANGINSRMARLGFTAQERPILQDLFSRFGSTVQELINEKKVPVPTPEEAQRMSTTATIRETLANFPMFQRAWEETVTRLKTDNPNSLFFSKLDNAMAEPFGAGAVARVVRESGNDLRDLIFRHYSTQGRIGNELANSLTEKLGLPEDQALKVQELFDNHYRQLLNTTAKNELEQTMKRLGNPATKAKGELERLTDLMAIGGLDKQEYYNLLAKRFGLGAWDQENIGRMKEAGAMLQRLRDEGGPEVYKNQIAAQIADEIAKNQPGKDINLRRAEGLWMSSLLTGPFTHGSYYGQNISQVMLNLGLRNLFKRGVGISDFGDMMKDLFTGMVHSAKTELPYMLQTGIHTQRELPGGEVAGMHAEGIPYRSALESTPLPGGMQNPLNWYRYVGRFLHGMETVFYRGANNAITRSLAIRLADERGMSSEEGQRFAEQMVYGTENDRQEAIQQAREERQRYGFDSRMLGIRTQELIDQKRSARAPELADEAHRFALHSIYRESPYGFLGLLARKLSDARRDNPLLSGVVPFINLPANVANEFMNWTPVGLLRGRDALMGFKEGTKGLESMYKDVPQFQRLVESGGITNRELRDISYEYLAKGAVGTLGLGALGAYSWFSANNPNAPLAINGAGPTQLQHRDALRAAGWIPYSIRVGDRYFSYEASPFKSALGMVGGISDSLKYGKPDAENALGELLNIGIHDSLQSVTDASFLQGLQTVLSASGGGGPEMQQKMDQFLSQEMATAAMIPFGGTGTKQLYRVFDSRQFEGKDVVGMVARNIPGFNSAFLQPKLNVLGEPVESNPVNRLLVAPSVETQDPVWKFIDQHNLNISLPNAGRKVDGEQMSPAELHQFTLARGQYLKAELGEAINNPEFRALDRDEMDAYVKELERNADDVGKAQIQERRGSR